MPYDLVASHMPSDLLASHMPSASCLLRSQCRIWHMRCLGQGNMPYDLLASHMPSAPCLLRSQCRIWHMRCLGQGNIAEGMRCLEGLGCSRRDEVSQKR